MNSTTLRGIFPDPKPVYRKNFMRENMKLIKRMEEKHTKIQEQLKSDTKLRSQSQTLIVPSKYKNVAKKVATSATKAATKERPKSASTTPVVTKKGLDKSVQTERLDLSPKFQQKSPKRPFPDRNRACGDNVDKLARNINKIDLDEKTAVSNCKKKEIIPQNKNNRKPEPELINEKNEKGLVLLPDEERREYLRVARENYAGLIKELNIMPVRNDTLRRRNRKIEIEKELKRLDEVIKIFQKPKVFVKAD